MSVVLVLSIAIRVAALIGSIVLAWRLRDRRVLILTLLCALMASRQTMTLIASTEGAESLTFGSHLEELPGLGVSIATLLLICFLPRIIRAGRDSKAAQHISEERFRRIFDEGPVGIVLVSPDARLLRVNQALCDMLGYTVAELTDAHLSKVLHPDDCDDGVSMVQRLQSGRIDSYQAERRYVHRDGRVVWANVQASVVRDEAGAVQFAIGIIEDVDEQRRTMDALRQSEQRFRSLVEQAADAFFLHDPDGRILDVNEQACRSLGYAREELLAMHIWDISLNDAEDCRRIWRDFMAGDRPVTIASEHRRKDGSTFPVDVRIGNMERGDQSLILGLARDATEKRAAEQALRQSEQRYRNIVEDQTEMISRFLPDGTLTFVNEACCRYFGKSREQLVGSSFLPLVFEGDRSMVKDYLASLSATSSVASEIDHRVRLSDGRLRWHQWTSRAIIDDAGAIVEYQGVGRDVTAQREAEEALKESRQHLQTVLDTVPDFIMTADREGTILYINRVVDGLNYDEAIGSSLYDDRYLPPDSRPIVRSAVERVFATGKPQQYQIEGLGDDGQPAWYQGRLAPIWSGDRVVAATIVATDVTEHRRAERALRESEERYALALAGTNEGLWDWNVQQNTSFYSERMRDLLGYSLAEFPNDPDAFPRLLHPDDKERVISTVYRHLEHRTPYDVEYRLRTKSGSFRWFRARGQATWDKDGKPLRMAGAIQDIHDRKTAQQQLAIQAEQLRVANDRLRTEFSERIRAERERASLQEQFYRAQKLEAVGQIAGGAAHDFNNLLTVIAAHTQHIRRHAADEAQILDSLATMDQAVTQAAEVAKSLLAFGRRRHGAKKVVDLTEAVRHTMRMARRIVPASIEVNIDLPHEPVAVLADSVQLQQALLNLAMNARDAMPAGGKLSVSLTIATPPSGNGDTPRPVAALRIADTGEGMTDYTLGHAFKPFFTTKPPDRGTGLGLTAVKSIVEDHGGAIRVQSKRGNGTAFEITLPLADAAQLPTERHEVDTPPLRGRGETIVLTEDNEQVRAVVAAELVALGYDVVQAADGDAMLDAARKHRADIRLMVLDLDLPRRNGLDGLRTLRDEGLDVPAIITTGDHGSVASQHLDARTALLAKPFSMRDLGDMVRAMLREGE